MLLLHVSELVPDLDQFSIHDVSNWKILIKIKWQMLEKHINDFWKNQAWDFMQNDTKQHKKSTPRLQRKRKKTLAGSFLAYKTRVNNEELPPTDQRLNALIPEYYHAKQKHLITPSSREPGKLYLWKLQQMRRLIPWKVHSLLRSRKTVLGHIREFNGRWKLVK